MRISVAMYAQQSALSCIATMKPGTPRPRRRLCPGAPLYFRTWRSGAGEAPMAKGGSAAERSALRSGTAAAMERPEQRCAVSPSRKEGETWPDDSFPEMRMDAARASLWWSHPMFFGSSTHHSLSCSTPLGLGDSGPPPDVITQAALRYRKLQLHSVNSVSHSSLSQKHINRASKSPHTGMDFTSSSSHLPCCILQFFESPVTRLLSSFSNYLLSPALALHFPEHYCNFFYSEVCLSFLLLLLIHHARNTRQHHCPVGQLRQEGPSRRPPSPRSSAGPVREVIGLLAGSSCICLEDCFVRKCFSLQHSFHIPVSCA